MPERLLDVVAEHPQENHVAEEMQRAAVDELIGEQADLRRHAADPRNVVDESRRNRAVVQHHHFHVGGDVVRQRAELEREGDDVDRDQRPGDERLDRLLERIVIPQRHHHGGTPLARSAILARHPQHVGRALVVGVAAGDEQEVRQPVDVFERGGSDAFALGVGKRDHQALGAAADRAREMQIGGGGTAAGQHERAQRGETGVELVDLAFEPVDLRLGDGEPRAARALAGRDVGVAHIGLDVEQVVLDARERRVECLVGTDVQPREPDDRVGLVERAVGVDAAVVFLAPFAVAERGRAGVAGTGVDAVEDDHGPAQRPIAQIVAMMMTMATNCSSTRMRISFCDRLGEPPRIMLTRPSSSTTATAPMAIGTATLASALAMALPNIPDARWPWDACLRRHAAPGRI